VSAAEDRRKARAKYRRGRADRGVCANCRRPAVKGRRCVYHYGLCLARAKALYHRRKRAGQCVRCGVEHADGIYCGDCKRGRAAARPGEGVA
jgi:hypothetical protein